MTPTNLGAQSIDRDQPVDQLSYLESLSVLESLHPHRGCDATIMNHTSICGRLHPLVAGFPISNIISVVDMTMNPNSHMIRSTLAGVNDTPVNRLCSVTAHCIHTTPMASHSRFTLTSSGIQLKATFLRLPAKARMNQSTLIAE